MGAGDVGGFATPGGSCDVPLSNMLPKLRPCWCHCMRRNQGLQRCRGYVQKLHQQFCHPSARKTIPWSIHTFGLTLYRPKPPIASAATISRAARTDSTAAQQRRRCSAGAYAPPRMLALLLSTPEAAA